MGTATGPRGHAHGGHAAGRALWGYPAGLVVGSFLVPKLSSVVQPAQDMAQSGPMPREGVQLGGSWHWDPRRPLAPNLLTAALPQPAPSSGSTPGPSPKARSVAPWGGVGDAAGGVGAHAFHQNQIILKETQVVDWSK